MFVPVYVRTELPSLFLAVRHELLIITLRSHFSTDKINLSALQQILTYAWHF